MFAKTYFDNAVRCFARWLDLLATDRRMAWEYHARGRELVAAAAHIKGLDEGELRRAAFRHAIYL
jgi:hypothetical protein